MTFQAWKGILLMGINMSYFNVPLKFLYGHAFKGHPFKRPVFLLSIPMARPLALTHDSGKAQYVDRGFCHCSIPPSLLGKQHGIHPLSRFVFPSSVRVVVFQTGHFSFALELPPINQAALCCLVTAVYHAPSK